MRLQTREMAASLLALGLDPERCTLFVQSHRPEHTELMWLLANRIIAHYAAARERYAELMANPAEVDGILEAGADRLRPKAAATMAEVREKMGLR
jgi:tryptophanyl-tRNA synthetase